MLAYAIGLGTTGVVEECISRWLDEDGVNLASVSGTYLSLSSLNLGSCSASQQLLIRRLCLLMTFHRDLKRAEEQEFKARKTRTFFQLLGFRYSVPAMGSLTKRKKKLIIQEMDCVA